MDTCRWCRRPIYELDDNQVVHLDSDMSSCGTFLPNYAEPDKRIGSQEGETA